MDEGVEMVPAGCGCEIKWKEETVERSTSFYNADSGGRFYNFDTMSEVASFYFDSYLKPLTT